MLPDPANSSPILPRSKLWWLALALLLILSGWFYLRGYNVSLPYFLHSDEVHHIAGGAAHSSTSGMRANGVHEAYPPGTKTLNYLLLKHIKPVEAHHGTMLPALRLITITAWTLVIVLVALLGAMIAASADRANGGGGGGMDCQSLGRRTSALGCCRMAI